MLGRECFEMVNWATQCGNLLTARAAFYPSESATKYPGAN